MDIDWKLWLAVAQWGFTLIVSFILWIRSGSSANAAAISEQQRKQIETDKRMERLEAQQKAMPTPAAFSAMEREVSGVAADVKGMSAQVRLVYEYLLNKD